MPSSTDSMVAPSVLEMPRSLQNATRCCCGIDIVTQHRNPAKRIRANATWGCQPSTARCVSPVRCPCCGFGVTGGGRRKMIAIGTITTSCSTANPIMVERQPKLAMARSNTVGQMKPAR